MFVLLLFVCTQHLITEEKNRITPSQKKGGSGGQVGGGGVVVVGVGFGESCGEL